MLKQPPRLTLQHVGPVLEAHLLSVPSRVIPALLTDDVDRADLAVDLRATLDAGLVVADVPLVGRDPGLSVKARAFSSLPA